MQFSQPLLCCEHALWRPPFCRDFHFDPCFASFAGSSADSVSAPNSSHSLGLCQHRSVSVRSQQLTCSNSLGISSCSYTSATQHACPQGQVTKVIIVHEPCLQQAVSPALLSNLEWMLTRPCKGIELAPSRSTWLFFQRRVQNRHWRIVREACRGGGSWWYVTVLGCTG